LIDRKSKVGLLIYDQQLPFAENLMKICPADPVIIGLQGIDDMAILRIVQKFHFILSLTLEYWTEVHQIFARCSGIIGNYWTDLDMFLRQIAGADGQLGIAK